MQNPVLTMGKARNIIKLCMLLFITVSMKVDAQQLWADVRLNKSNVFVGEPVEVSITVYTSTWFTKGVDLGNIQVNGAYSVFFRPVSRSIVQGGKTYAGVELKYNVFPYAEKNITFPALDIKVETPPEGQYKGVKRKVTSAAKTIVVKPIPPNFEGNEWLVAGNLRVSQRWSGDINNIKVGDVLTRRIGRTAFGTVPELIPPVNWDSIQGISLYPTRSNLESNRNKTSISGSRTEGIQYLFEQEGEIVLPEMVFSWYNPYQNKLYKRTLKEVTIQVAANPELGLVASVRDSLMLQQERAIDEAVSQEPNKILGLSIKQFLLLVLFVLIALYSLYRLLKVLIPRVKARRQAYLNSEAYYFKKFKSALRSGNQKNTQNSLYRWLDELQLETPNVREFIRIYGSNDMNPEQLENISIQQWSNARRNYVRSHQKRRPVQKMEWINP